MIFAITVLHYLATRTAARRLEDLFLPELTEPLMRRSKSRKVDSSRIWENLDLAIDYLERSYRARALLSIDRRYFIFDVAILWSQEAYVFKEHYSHSCALSATKLGKVG